MSNDDTKSSRNRERATLESILPKKGKLPITIAQLSNLRLKQLPPEGSKIVIVFEGNGNITTGITDQNVQMTSITDIQRMNAARTLAHRILGVQKKQEMEVALAETVLATVGPADVQALDPTPACVQELRRAHVEIDRVASNLADIERLSAPDPLRKRIKTYLTDMAKRTKDALIEHINTQLTRNAAKKEEVNMHALLLAWGIPRVIYNKLVQTNLVESMQTDVYNIVFGTKISKGMKLSLEELNCKPLMEAQGLMELLAFRNLYTLKAARTPDVYEYMKTGLDDVDLKRLSRIQLTMVGPGNHSREWRMPQPLAPIPYDAVGELLLKINQNEVNFHSGVIPIGVRPHEFWSYKVLTDVGYNPQDQGKIILGQASDDGQKVSPTAANGFTVYPRDIDRGAQRQYILIGKMARHLPAPKQDSKDPPVPEVIGQNPLDVGIIPYVKGALATTVPMPNPKHYMQDGAGATWYTGFVKKIFLRPSADMNQKRRTGGLTNRKLPANVFKGVTRLNVDKDLRADLGRFLMQFASDIMMQKAFDLFEAELQKMELDGSWMAPVVDNYDVDDDQANYFE